MDPGRGPGGRPGYGGPGDGYYPGGSSTTSSSSGGSSLPVWALVLIMLASGLVTLIVLWLCVLLICRKRRARRAAIRDFEAQTAWAAEHDTARLNPPAFGDKDVDLKRCEANSVELTYVVMAGEDQPSFLARPAANVTSSDEPEDQAPPSSKEVPISPPPTLDHGDDDVSVNPHKSPPSPSR